MKAVKMLVKSEQYSALDMGALSEIGQYVYTHPAMPHPGPGKLFLGEALDSSAMEVSFNEMPEGREVPFYHRHHENEEIYIFLKGNAILELDGKEIQVGEGSVVRVAPDVSRILKNSAKEPLRFLVLQAKAGSIKHFQGNDGSLVEG